MTKGRDDFDFLRTDTSCAYCPKTAKKPGRKWQSWKVNGVTKWRCPDCGQAMWRERRELKDTKARERFEAWVADHAARKPGDPGYTDCGRGPTWCGGGACDSCLNAQAYAAEVARGFER